MLGRLLQRTGPAPSSAALTNGAVNTQSLADDERSWRDSFEQIEWSDPNKKNLVAEGDMSQHASPNQS
jgi:carbamoyl-phosphate synthase/aspartate carbamoyltransferase